MKLINDGRLCCHSLYKLAKYASNGHFIISLSVTFLFFSDSAEMVVFSSKGASIVSLGVVKRIVKALK